MADRACYKSPLDLWCGTFSLNSKVTFFILIINASQITKTSEQSRSPLIWFCDAHTYLFFLMRCCPYLPPLSLSVSFSLPGILFFTSLSFALCLLLLGYKSSAASAAAPLLPHDIIFQCCYWTRWVAERGGPAFLHHCEGQGVLTLCALLQMSMQNKGE